MFLLAAAITLAAASPAHGTEVGPLTRLPGEPVSPAPPESLLAWFDSAWAIARSGFYDTTIVHAQLTDENRLRLRAQVAALETREGLATMLSGFLQSEGISHTGVYTPNDLDWWVLRDRRHLQPEPPWHVGAMFAHGPDGWVVRAVLEGYPAAQAGLRRGDVVLAAAGRPFHPFGSFSSGAPVHLDVLRGQRRFMIPAIAPVNEDPVESFRRAILNSVRHVDVAGRRLGVVHLWCCLGSGQAETLREALRDSLAGCDGIVLDLRDGYGGLFTDFLDLFYADRHQRVPIPYVDRGGWHSADGPGRAPVHYCFPGPLVVVVNEGTRSAKEIIAFQLQHAHRATLVGARTAGACCSAYVGFADVTRRLLVEVPGSQLLPGGERIEGVGVRPDVEVPWPLESPGAGDPQMQAALRVLRRRIGD